MQSILTSAIICGDCIDKIKQHIPTESIDLIYMDPPFFSGRNYEIIWNDGAEVRSFEDKEFYKRVCGNCEKKMPHEYVSCPYCGASGEEAKEIRMNDIESYIEWLRGRLLECYRVLKSTGSIYVHLDWHAVHYVKVMMDEIFGYNNFQNEVIWSYKSGGSTNKRFSRKHDNILFYSKSNNFIFNSVKEKSYNRGFKPYRFKNVEEFEDESGWYTNVNMKDVWNIDMLGRSSKERLGYPTQKPEALLERIINASSNSGNLILDPFCGCGTSISVAQRLGRRWIGIDVSPTSCDIMIDRVRKIGYDLHTSEIIDMPKSVEQLKTIAPFEFQNRISSWLGGRQTTKKSGDRGIDGYTFDQTPIQVKQSDKVGNPVVRLFAQDIRDVNKSKGIIVAFSFSKTAETEVKHIRAKHGIIIKLVTVDDIINFGPDCTIVKEDGSE
jgi:DNA modification methylase